MIQKPFPILDACKNIDNIKDSGRRFREYFRNQDNPNNKQIVSQAQFDSYFKFTFVRNPWDRALSWYKNIIRDSIHQKNYNVPSDISFKEFIYRFAGTGYLRPQTYWLKDYSGKIDFDFIGKFEQLEYGFEKVVNEIGLVGTSLPHEIASLQGNSNKSYFDDDIVDFISKYYKEEIELFGYSYNE
jgi:hypothetical protein